MENSYKLLVPQFIKDPQTPIIQEQQELPDVVQLQNFLEIVSSPSLTFVKRWGIKNYMVILIRNKGFIFMITVLWIVVFFTNFCVVVNYTVDL